MKRFCAVFVIFGLGVGVGTLLDEQVSVAEAGQEPRCAPLLVTGGGVVIQDIDGDGDFNPITEAVRLLSWAFLGGPAPVPPCAGGGPSGLPDSGQAVCYGFVEGSGWVERPCAEAACPGQDGSYATGCHSEGRFTDNGDGTVTDHCTGLVWQKDTADTNGDGQFGVESDVLRWCEALSYCENLNFAGHDDWRLPNVRELQSIVDYGRRGRSIDPVFGAGSYYWSSTSYAENPRSRAWFVNFDFGDVGHYFEDSVYHVRAVRSEP